MFWTQVCLGKFPTAILGNDLCTKYQRPQRLGKLGLPIRDGMDVFVPPKERTKKSAVCSRFPHASGSRTLGLVEQCDVPGVLWSLAVGQDFLPACR